MQFIAKDDENHCTNWSLRWRHKNHDITILAFMALAFTRAWLLTGWHYHLDCSSSNGWLIMFTGEHAVRFHDVEHAPKYTMLGKSLSIRLTRDSKWEAIDLTSARCGKRVGGLMKGWLKFTNTLLESPAIWSISYLIGPCVWSVVPGCWPATRFELDIELLLNRPSVATQA